MMNGALPIAPQRIIRYVNDYDDDPTAESIMKLALGRNPTKSDSLNAIDVIKVAAMYDLYRAILQQQKLKMLSIN